MYTQNKCKQNIEGRKKNGDNIGETLDLFGFFIFVFGVVVAMRKRIKKN